MMTIPGRSNGASEKTLEGCCCCRERGKSRHGKKFATCESTSTQLDLGALPLQKLGAKFRGLRGTSGVRQILIGHGRWILRYACGPRPSPRHNVDPLEDKRAEDGSPMREVTSTRFVGRLSRRRVSWTQSAMRPVDAGPSPLQRCGEGTSKVPSTSHRPGAG